MSCQLTTRRGACRVAVALFPLIWILTLFTADAGEPEGPRGLLLDELEVHDQASTEKLRQLGIEAFEAADYVSAVEFITQALEHAPRDAELHYLLGYYLHYLCYDSVPLPGFSRETSDEVLAHLSRAVELDPGMGDARYFMSAEYGGRAREELRHGDVEGAREQLVAARSAGAFPDWLLEYGRNTLESCGANGILILGGDAETNAVHYMQLIEGVRTDVTAIPAALLERPWFIEILTQGVEDAVKPVKMEWSLDQIRDMRPYKWKANVIRLPIAGEDRERFIEWSIRPDLTRGDGRQLLGAGRAAFAEILRANRFVRPVHFSPGSPVQLREGLEDHVRLSGFAFRLDPEPGAGESGVDLERTRQLLLDVARYRDLPNIVDTDMPRVSGILQNYRACFLRLASAELQHGRTEQAREVLEAMEKHVPESVLPMPAGIAEAVRRIRG